MAIREELVTSAVSLTNPDFGDAPFSKSSAN